MIFLLSPCGGQTFAAAESTRPDERAPNILLILADDLGWADLPSYGNKVTSTPNLDALAREGMRFTRFYAAPVCSPSRAELQSGQYAARTGITDFISGHWRPFEKVVTPRPALAYPATAVTIGEALRRRGYATGYFGKWHLGEPQVEPAARGYDEALAIQGHLTAEGRKTVEVIGERAVAFLERRRDTPFFLMLSPFQPHVPLRAEADKIEKYEARLEQAGASLPDPIYAAMIDDLDGLVGRVLRRLEELKLSDSTLIVFVSDNGGLEYLDLGLNDRVTSNAPLRGEKGTVYEGGIRVPAVMRWPGVIEAHTLQATPAALYDLLPTFLDVAGAPESERDTFDGRSLGALLRAEDAMQASERSLYFHYPHYHHGRPASAVIHGAWKLIENLDDGSIELYHLEHDVGEALNLAQTRPEIKARLKRMLDTWRNQIGARLPTPNPDYDPARAHEWWQFDSKQPYEMNQVREWLQRGTLHPTQ